jgi:hypothetical protein
MEGENTSDQIKVSAQKLLQSICTASSILLQYRTRQYRTARKLDNVQTEQLIAR